VVEARPGRRGAEFWRLVDGAYEPIPLDAAGRLWSTVVDGFWLDPAWLEQDPLPDAWPLVAVIAPTAARAALSAIDLEGPSETNEREATR